MAKLKRDQRLCPYCAEAIKASAIRCRFCHSEIEPVAEPVASGSPKVRSEPTVEPDSTSAEADSKPPKATKAKATKAKATETTEAAEATDATEPEPVEASDAEPEIEPKPTRDRPPFYRNLSLVSRNLTVILAVLVALAGAGVGALWWQAEHSSAATAPDGTLVGDEARNEVLIAAADLAQRTLSYDYRTLANDKEVAVARMTPDFRKEYESTMTQLGDNTTKNEIVLQAVAVSSAIIKATDHKAEVLVFLNQTTTAGTGKDQNQQASRNSLVVSLERGDGDWDISGLTALG